MFAKSIERNSTPCIDCDTGKIRDKSIAGYVTLGKLFMYFVPPFCFDKWQPFYSCEYRPRTDHFNTSERGKQMPRLGKYHAIENYCQSFVEENIVTAKRRKEISCRLYTVREFPTKLFSLEKLQA